jgi:hypothetical protein
MAKFESTNPNDKTLWVKAASGQAEDIVDVQAYDGTSYFKIDKDGNVSLSGLGDVTGPSSSTDNTIARFNGLSGKIIQGSGVIISDLNVMSGFTADAAVITGTLDGDQLPAMSTTKKGGVPATGTPSGKYLRDDGTWQTISGSGDVVGPSSSTDNAITRFDSTTGKLIQNSLATVADTGGINIPTGETYNINGSPHSHTGLVTNGDSHDHSGGDGAQINHTTLSNIGSNTHSQIDTHLGSSSNPHSVTASQVGLGNVTNNAQVKKISSSTDNQLVRWDGTTGDTIQGCPTTFDDSGYMSAGGLYGAQGFYTTDPKFPVTNAAHATLAEPTVGEMALSKAFVGNKTQFVVPTVEYTENGTDWYTHPISASDLKNIVMGRYASGAITIAKTYVAVRVTFTAPSYSYLNYLYNYLEVNYHDVTIKIERSYGDDINTWSTVAESAVTDGWPTHALIPHTVIPWNATPTPGTHSKYVRITYTPAWQAQVNPIHIYRIDWFGTYPCNPQDAVWYWDSDENFYLKKGLNLATNNSYDLGSGGARFKDGYFGGTIQTNGYVATNGGTSGGGTGHYSLWTGGENRWLMGMGGTESTGNLGSNFKIWAYDDDGNYLRDNISIDRKYGTFHVEGDVDLASGKQYKINGSALTYTNVGAAPSAEGVTNGNSHDHSGGDGAQISHTTLSNIGSNSHSTIDTHLGSTSNPHSTTASQVGLGNVTNNAQVKKIGSSTDNAILRWDGTTGDLPQDSVVTIADTTGAISINAHQAITDPGATPTGKFLRDDGTWTSPSGSGDVVGPGSATDNALPRFDTTTGKLLQNSVITVADSTGALSINAHQALTDPGASPSGKYLRDDGTWQTVSGSGDVVGPAGATDNAIARFDTATGKLLQNSLATVDDNGSVNIPTGQAYKINNAALAYGDVGAAASGHNHDAAYISLVTTPTAGNFPVLTAGGELNNSTYSNASFAPSTDGVTNGNSHDHSGGDGAQINHTTLSNIGSNSHSTIDTHLGSTSNPHSTTASQVGLGNVTNNAQVKKIGSSTDNAILRWDGTTGDLPQDSVVTIADTTGTISINAHAALSDPGATPTGKFLRDDGTWQTPGGSGDVVGPASATDRAIALFNSTTGKLIQNSLVTIDINGSPNIPTGQTYKINGSAHTHSASDVGLGNVTNNAQIKDPGSSVDEQVLRWDGTSGDTVQACLLTVSDTGTCNIPTGQTYNINGSAHTHTGLVTNGDSHDHSGGDGAQINHTTLSNIGTNTHAQIDTHLGAASPHSGHVVANGAITGATNCKITYDAKGLVTAGTTIALADFPSGTGYLKGSGGTPTYGSIILADLPTVDPTKGGTGQTTCAKGDLFQGSGSNTVGKLTVGTNNYILVADSSQSTGAKWASDVVAIPFIIDGGGSAITTGQKGHIEIPFACTITGWTLLADQSGSITIDTWKDTYGNFPPTVADTMWGTKPALSSAQKAQATGLSIAVTAGDIIAYNVDSATTVTRVTLSFTATKSR